LFYQAARELGAIFFKREYAYNPGTVFTGGGGRELDHEEPRGGIRALEATTGRLKWDFELLTPPYAGVLSTAGDLVFGGAEEGNFFALDAENGKLLWELQLGANIKANPISFALDGKQYVAITAGAALFAFSLP
jgi:alcohol dehydrogenase (cytochrome c)